MASQVKMIPRLKGDLILIRFGDQLRISGYIWTYPDGHRDRQDFDTYKMLETISEPSFGLLVEGLPGIPTPLFRRDDVEPGEYNDLTGTDIRDNDGYNIVTYVKSNMDNYVYKHGFEKNVRFNGQDREGPDSDIAITLYDMGRQRAKIYLDSSYEAGDFRFYNEDGLIISSDYLNSPRGEGELYQHMEYKGPVYDGYFYSYQVNSRKIDFNQLKVDQGQLVFPLTVNRILNYFNVVHGKLKGPFWFEDAEGTFNGKFNYDEQEDVIKLLTTFPMEELVEGYFRWRDDEFYISKDGTVLSYRVWQPFLTKDVNKKLGTENIPEIGKIISDYTVGAPIEKDRGFPASIDKPRREYYYLSPKGGYQTIIKENIEPMIGKQDEVTKIVLDYLREGKYK